jgi:hypothetical protein
VCDLHGNVTHLLAVLRDETNEIKQQESIAAAQAEIASQREAIAGQQAIIESLSTPVVQVYSSGHNHCAPVGRAASRISA